jgi:hypothetical protein
MALPASLILTYKIEYETTSITLDSLIEKYDINLDDIPDISDWRKQTEAEPEVEILAAPQPRAKRKKAQPKVDIVTTLPAKTSPLDAIVEIAPEEIAHENQDVLDQIDEFKRLTLAKATKFVRDEADYADIKDLKDVVSIVDTIEKSYKGVKQGPAVNILVQNLVERFRDGDDC